MSRRLFREFYLLPRGEQRALILLSLLLILSLLFRITISLIPEREPGGMEEFEQEARSILASLAAADSLRQSTAGKLMVEEEGPPAAGFRDRTPEKRGYPPQPIDINRADSVQLLPLPGIGPVYAGRIVKYRNLLGGFVQVEQLAEVYGISMETLDRIRERIYADTTAIRKIRLDSATFSDLLRHPYLKFENVKALVEYRDFAGTIQSPRELQDNAILPDTLLQKLIPYLNFGQ
jgi:competence ComEA-like helix-hairpin-helix protein